MFLHWPLWFLITRCITCRNSYRTNFIISIYWTKHFRNNYIIISSWRRKQNNIVSILQDIARSKLNSLSNLENRIFHGSYLQQNLEWLKPKSESIVHFSLRQSWRIKTWIFASLLPSLTTEFPKSSAGKRKGNSEYSDCFVFVAFIQRC